jgi:class III poly(R)-hydroxyalkanoic acid synthase PhaE subunit
MESNSTTGGGPESILTAWLQMAGDFWRGMLHAMPQAADSAGMTDERAGDASRLRENWETGLRTWQLLAVLIGDTSTLETLDKSGRILPDFFGKMLQSLWSGYFELQRQWFEKAGRIGASSQAYDFENLDLEARRLFSELYEKEFRQFLFIPPVGLTRFYQERTSLAIDKFHRFQAAMTEFLQLLYLPMEKSLKVLQNEIAELGKKGELPQDPKAYYERWIRILEGHYMTLFKSPEYTAVMGKTLGALQEFSMAKRAVLEDLLGALPVPSQKEMDSLYKELYTLKKRVNALEKERNRSGS